MRAIANYEYGSPDVLQLVEIKKPAPKENEVLVKVHAAGLNAADWHLMRGEPFLAKVMFGLFKPSLNVLGADISGVVECIGKNVTQFKVGDEVFADLSSDRFGGFAEYVCAPENTFVKKPANLSHVEAAAIPLAALTALHALRDVGKITKGKKVAINGASGGVGTFAIQVAKAFGADVTAICSQSKTEQAKALGADSVIDYTKEDFTQNGRRYDIIIGANGYHPLADYKRVLNTNGKYVMAGGTNKQMWEAMLLGPFYSVGSKKLGNVMSKANRDDLMLLKDMIETNTLKPVIDRIYPLEETANAMRYLEEGHAKGKIIVTMNSDS